MIGVSSIVKALTPTLLKLAKPAGRFILGVVMREVFKAEFKFGSGKGEQKLADAVTNINKELAIELDEIKDVVNAIVDVLNAIGVFDEDPGLNFSGLDEIIAKVMVLVDTITDLVD